MATSLALKRLVSSSLLSRPLRPLSSSTSRLFNTTALRYYDDDSDDRDVDRRVFSPFSDAFPLSRRSSSLSQILNAMDRIMESPAISSVRRNWNARESEEGLHLRVDMPGLGKEDVKVSVEHNTLIIQGELGKKEENGRRYSSRIDLPEKLYKTNEIKGEMKNGVLKLFVPKIKEEDRKDVFHVNVE